MPINPRKTGAMPDVVFIFRRAKALHQVHSGVKCCNGNPIRIFDRSLEVVNKGSISIRFGSVFLRIGHGFQA
jgi:hypothetical protein